MLFSHYCYLPLKIYIDTNIWVFLIYLYLYFFLLNLIIIIIIIIINFSNSWVQPDRTRSMWVGLGWIKYFLTHHGGLGQKISLTRPMHTPSCKDFINLNCHKKGLALFLQGSLLGHQKYWKLHQFLA